MERGHAYSYYDDRLARGDYGPSRVSANYDRRLPSRNNSFHPEVFSRWNFNNMDTKQKAGSGFASESVKSAQNGNGDNNAPKSWQEQDSNLESSEKKKGVVRIFQRFAERCSMQGPAYIQTSTWWFSRLAWVLLLLAFVGVMAYHLIYLSKTFFAWPTKNKLSLGFASLQFPAVTICNVNPIRASQLSLLSSDLNRFLQRIDPDAIGGVIEKLPNSTTSSRRRRLRRQANEDEDYDFGDEDNTQLDDIDFGQDSSNFSNAREDVDDSDFDDLDGYSDSWEKEAKKSAFAKLEQDFKELYSTETRSSRVRAGHLIKDMMLSCSFSGKSCYARNFTLSTSTTFGNCYTLEYTKFISRASGPGGGLEVLLFLDTEEYLRGVTPADGLHVTIHPQSTVAFPEDEGVAVAAGSQTFLSLKLIQIERADQPYGHCVTKDAYFDKYRVMYSIQMCNRFCEQGEIHRACQCRDETEEYLNRLMNATTYRPCRKKEVLVAVETCQVQGIWASLEHSFLEMACLVRVKWRYQNGELTCSCYNPCQESKYEKSMSSRPWPNQEYAQNVLVKIACQRVSQEKCQRLKAKQSHELSREFVKLNIFYEDLNYENITEEADYETVQFISDVGGTLGLWIGLSLLSIMEVIQLVVELIRYLCCCRWNAARSGK